MSPSMKRPTIEGLPSPAARTANQDSTPQPAFDVDAVGSVKRHPRLAAAVAAVVLVLVLAYGLSRKPTYQAESLTYIEPMASKVLNESPTQDGYDSVRYDTYIQQQMQTALRPDILAKAIGKLPPFVWQFPGESIQSAVGRLQGALKVERVSTSYQLSISISNPNPETAAAVVNAVTNTYLEQGRKDEHAVIDQRLQLLGEERQRIQQNLDEDRVEQASLGGALGLANPTGLVGNQYDTQIAGVQTQVATAREARDAAAAQLAALQGPGGGTNSPALAAAAEELINGDAGLNSMKGTINERKAVLNTQMAGLTTSNPIYRQDQAEIADLDRSLEAATAQLRERTERRLQDKMRADLQRTADIENRLNAQLKQQTATATSAAPKLQRATEIAADIERLNARYGVVDDAMRGLQLESNGPGSAHLSVAAAVPVSPEPSKRKLILLMAFPLAMIAGIGAAVLARRLDPKIYSGPDVEKVLGFLPIGVMPARDEVSERVMEEYALRLAAGLQSAYRTSSAQSFVFTAASSTMEIGPLVRAIEGRLGALGFKALVKDAGSMLHGTNRPQNSQRGLMAQRSNALVRTIDGVRQGFAAEEIDKLKQKFDLLLIDAPPLLNSAETEYLVRCADATILIAESGVTLKSELFQSAVLLQQLNVAGVGAVLQELHLKDADASFRAAVAAVERLQRGVLPEVAMEQKVEEEMAGTLRGGAHAGMTPDSSNPEEARLKPDEAREPEPLGEDTVQESVYDFQASTTDSLVDPHEPHLMPVQQDAEWQVTEDKKKSKTILRSEIKCDLGEAC